MTTTKKAKASRSKVRVNVCLSRNTIEQAETLRVAEHRNSFSNVVESLIAREWEKRKEEAAAA